MKNKIFKIKIYFKIFKIKKNSVVLVLMGTISTKIPQPADEVSANFG
jgi:hypothetical protein